MKRSALAKLLDAVRAGGPDAEDALTFLGDDDLAELEFIIKLLPEETIESLRNDESMTWEKE